MQVPPHEMVAAQRAYEAYCKYTGNKSLVTGDQLPVWDNLKGEIKNAWHFAAKAAANVYAMKDDVFFKIGVTPS